MDTPAGDSPAGPDPEKLLVRISDGESLTAEEVEEIAAVFRSIEAADVGRKRSIDDVYAFLVVAGRAKLTGLQYIIEKFLDVRDALTVALVLETLCVEWGCTGEYLERVLNFALGVAWDEDQDVQHAAIKILGEFLETSLPKTLMRRGEQGRLTVQQHRVLELLLSLFDDTELESWTRQSAYFSLCRAFGKAWEKIPSDCVQLDFAEKSKDIDWRMIQMLRAALAQLRLEVEESSSSESSAGASESISSGSQNPSGIR